MLCDFLWQLRIGSQSHSMTVKKTDFMRHALLEEHLNQIKFRSLTESVKSVSFTFCQITLAFQQKGSDKTGWRKVTLTETKDSHGNSGREEASHMISLWCVFRSVLATHLSISILWHLIGFFRPKTKTEKKTKNDQDQKQVKDQWAWNWVLRMAALLRSLSVHGCCLPSSNETQSQH